MRAARLRTAADVSGPQLVSPEEHEAAWDTRLARMEAAWGSPVSALCVAADRFDDPPLHQECRKIGCTCTCHTP
ncbi:hypothetical protein ACFVT1_16610 [Streptomyces sp. NPDC057963]|uniref:hypothetical protein n=1 Tax=Streptomyces sp. NPDC057963 TaxID=3346290 RepID=UPI0036E61741